MADLPDITRLRAALDVALTTLDSCSRPNSAAPSPARAAPPPPRRSSPEPEPPSNNAPTDTQNNPVPVRRSLSRPLDDDQTKDEPQQSLPIESVRVQVDQNLVERAASQEARIKELEEHILRKSKDELDLAKKALELEHQVEECNGQIQEYENKLAQVLPLLQTLDQSRQEAREAKRRAQITADELAALTGDHQLLAQELAKRRKECATTAEAEQAATQKLAESQAAIAPLTEQIANLEKQLKDEQEESRWLQEVAARQAKEMEASIESVKTALEMQTSKCEDLEEQQREMCNANDQLVARMKQQATMHALPHRARPVWLILKLQVAQVISRMSAGNAGLSEETEQLQLQLAALQAQQATK